MPIAKKSPAAKWDILRDNQTLRELIKRRMDELGLSMQALSEKSGIPYDHIRQYFKASYRWKGINQWNLIKLADSVGIQVSLSIELKYE